MSDIITKMLTALLKSDNLIHWIGGYVYGETSNGDPYILLYATQEHLKEKVCRVYKHDFGKLPAFIPTDNIRAATDSNPSKDVAERKGIYHKCPPFEVVLFNGKETSLGPEKRFSDVLRLSKAAQGAVSPTANSHTPPPPEEMFDLLTMAVEAEDNGRFMTKASAWLTDDLHLPNATSANVETIATKHISPGWTAARNHNRPMLAALSAYFSERKDGKSHEAAKAAAVNSYAKEAKQHV